MARDSFMQIDQPGVLPGSLRAVVPHPFGGSIVMSGFPGLETTFDGEAIFDPDSCRETVEGLRALGAGQLMLLVERDELDQIGFDLLARTCTTAGIAVIERPIVDYSVPSDTMMAGWHAERAARAAHLEQGGTFAVSCQHGAGRSGLMATLCLMEAGLTADDAMATVRSHFAQAVESSEQEAWLRSLTLKPSA